MFLKEEKTNLYDDGLEGRGGTSQEGRDDSREDCSCEHGAVDTRTARGKLKASGSVWGWVLEKLADRADPKQRAGSGTKKKIG